jgi:UDP-N-acetylmuramoylalanine--D-glutamate ligase
MKIDKQAKIGILGGGIEGIEAARYFLSHGYENITLFDKKEQIEENLPVGLKFYGGEDYLKKAESSEILFRSPGIHTDKLESVRKKGVKVLSTTQYFMEHCPCPIIGVTGTKGKGTTSTLITLMLKEAGYDAYLGGNIGQSPLTFLDRLSKKSIVVLEMSSFQLQDLEISPHIAVVLRVTTDHLDYHVNRQEYLLAKSSIVRHQKPNDIAVFNQDYEEYKAYVALTKAKKLHVTTRTDAKNGAFLKNGKIYFIAEQAKAELIGDIKKIALIGDHNLENVLPAVCVARTLKIDIPVIQTVIYGFTGLPHRLEFVREIDGVRYYNDSFSTTPETSIAATYAFKKSVILIAGGSDKGADYTEWGRELQKNLDLKAVLLIGEMSTRMHQALRKADPGRQKISRPDPLVILQAKGLTNAFYEAKKRAKAGWVVVISPGAASFDMFKNYKDRGEKFKQIVMTFDGNGL